MHTTASDTLAERLLARRQDLEALRPDWRLVEDIVSGSPALRGEEYLPRHSAEHPAEHRKRLRLTPLFAETPAILQARQGALFRRAPEIALPEALRYLFSAATLAGASVYDALAHAAELCQVQGFCGVLLDRAPLPDGGTPGAAGSAAGALSLAEARARGVGRVYLAPFPAAQILDWSSGAQGLGLEWVKLLETERRKPAWDAAPATVQCVRIVTREEILSYEAVEPPEGGPGVTEVRGPWRVRHGARDAEGRACVPFRFFHPFPARDGIGRPLLKAAAEADAAALWVLSELLWYAYLMCPLLTFTTGRSDDEIADLAIGANRFIPLRAKSAAHEEEKLEYVPLDPTALDRLLAVWERLAQRAREAGGRSAAALPRASEQSGVSKAWTFKTGEERVLFLLARELQSGFQWLFEQAGRMTSDAGTARGEAPPLIRFPDQFDVTDAAVEFGGAAEAARFFREQAMPAAAAQARQKAAEIALPHLDDATWKAIERQAGAAPTA